jgi:hypothetical protein
MISNHLSDVIHKRTQPLSDDRHVARSRIYKFILLLLCNDPQGCSFAVDTAQVC